VPQAWEESNKEIQAWDAEGFISAGGIQVPLRVLRADEVLTLRHRQGNGWIQEKETHLWERVTTLAANRPRDNFSILKSVIKVK
jgi:hypothetical protein